MKMKKILALLLCALLLVSVFTACGNNADKTTDTTKKVEDVTAPVETDPTETEPEETGEVAEAKVIKFQLVDKNGNVVIDTTFNYEEGKSVFDAMVANLKVDYTTSAYGPMVNGIYLLNDNSVGITAVWAETSSYLALYVDGEYSMVGIDGVTYHDGIAIKWVETPA